MLRLLPRDHQLHARTRLRRGLLAGRLQVFAGVDVDVEEALGQLLLFPRDPGVQVAAVRRGFQPRKIEKNFPGGHVFQLDPHVVDLTLGGHDARLDGGAAEKLVFAFKGNNGGTFLKVLVIRCY